MRINAGSRLGIVGENGRGKTTLPPALTGRTTPAGGRATRAGRAATPPRPRARGAAGASLPGARSPAASRDP
ncbi:ATP-binding cassette domain-containing protein, partial [Micrococcus luteus]|uniref:ATP-binding cassette domain-containing protein n=1 Tax=Micrococcus luteus TaxID=1270 RepID=UPI000567C2AF